jgi:hypothetical protein
LVVAFEAAYPSSLVAFRRLAKMEDEMERMDAKRPSSEGKSVVGNGGEEANKDAIWISAISGSGEPITAFCWMETPYNARKE